MTQQIEDVMALMEKKFDSTFNLNENSNESNDNNFKPLQESNQYHNNNSENHLDLSENNIHWKQSFQPKMYNTQKIKQEEKMQDLSKSYESPQKKINTITSIQVYKNGQGNLEMSPTQQEASSQNYSPPQQLDYRTLQAKIQSVLKKNQKYKDLATTSRMSKNNSALMLSRFQEYQKKKERSIEAKKVQIQNTEVKQLKAKPTINSKSKKIVDQCGYTPIFERFQKLVESRKKKQEQSEENKKQQAQKQYQKFMEEYKKHEKVPEGVRSYEQFFEQMVRWKERSKKHTQQQKSQIQQKLKKTHPFKPQLNQNSLKLIQNKTRIPVHQRQIVLKQSQLQYSFKPKINKKRVK